MPDPALPLHGTKLSGHAHRVEPPLRLLGRLGRVEALPGCVPMPRSPVPAVA